MRARTNRLGLTSGVLAVLIAQQAVATTPEFCPLSGGKVDPSVAVDKEALAGAALDTAGLTRPLERRLRGVRLERGMSLWQTLIVRGTGVCKARDGGPSTSDAIDCSDDEVNALNGAVINFRQFLRQTDQFLVTAPDLTASEFFTNDDRSLRCKGEEGGAASPKAAGGAGAVNPTLGTGGSKSGAATWSPGNIRVRGSATDLIYTRGSSGFASADKAQLSFGDNREEGKRSTKFVATLGYAFPVIDHQTASLDHISAGVVPYLGVNIDTSKSDGKPKSVSSDLVEFGSVLEFRRASAKPTTFAPFVSYISATPRILFNRNDHSRLAGFDLFYRPSFGVVNAMTPIGQSDIYWNVIGDIRVNNGIFLRQGTRTGETSRDFSRFGGRFGIGLATMGGSIPAEFTITDTYLVALAGEPGHLNLLKTNLSLYFNEKKYFGVDLGYSRGRYQDLDPRVDQWTIGFAVKY